MFFSLEKVLVIFQKMPNNYSYNGDIWVMLDHDTLKYFTTPFQKFLILYNPLLQVDEKPIQGFP